MKQIPKILFIVIISVYLAACAAGSQRHSSTGYSKVHVVKSGETLYGIARSYQVPVRSLIESNKLSPPYGLQVGQRIHIPYNQHYTVKSGDTLSTIAEKKGVSLTELAKLNDIRAPYVVRLGQHLKLPYETAASQQGERSVASTTAKTGSPAFGLQMPDKTKEHIAHANLSESQNHKIKNGPFSWPVRGKIIQGYGTIKEGVSNEGVNIAAPLGSPVLAANNGTVVYADDGLKGYGKLVLIKHADGWVTAYAHNQRLLVKKGDQVRRGQAIAQVGKTGNVSHPQLHFEIRKGRNTYDPISILGSPG